MTGEAITQATGLCDGDDRLVSADEPLLGLHLRCGGEMPGTIAVPALLEAVRKSRRFGMKLARPVVARDGSDEVTAWVEVEPQGDGMSRITVRHWQVRALPPELVDSADRQAQIDCDLAEFHARLDGGQAVLTAQAEAADLKLLAQTMLAARGRAWFEMVAVEGVAAGQALHWRMLHGAAVRVNGSDRQWRATLVPQVGVPQVGVPQAGVPQAGVPQAGKGDAPGGFDLYLTSDTPLPTLPEPTDAGPRGDSRLIGRDVAPVLRQPIARIIANAETIRTRMAGPLAEEYSNYAADIAAAGQHLLALIDDLADLEVVESDDFSTAPDRIDLADVARRAAGILGVRAREQGIIVDAPRTGEVLPAIAEFRRVLQVLLNLLGNAIRYSPANSQVWIRLSQEGDMAQVIVADQGPGIAADQQTKVFEKFERLGRSGDGGSGLGLYISRRLARAMGGDLTVESAPGQGARFVLSVPVAPSEG